MMLNENAARTHPASGPTPLVAQLTHLPFPEVARVLRAVADRITRAWDVAVREAMPQMRHLTFDELKDSTPQILLAIADALASDDPDEIRELVMRAPQQGLSRFRLNFDVTEVMEEDRLLRSLTVQHVEEGLGRRMDVPESAALHSAIDVMLQRSVIALVDKQKGQLREAAETELKFLSFLSHDIHNNLNTVVLLLAVLKGDLSRAKAFTEAEASLGLAERSIHETVGGMRRMLDHARLRQRGAGEASAPVDLHALAKRVAAQFAREAADRGGAVDVDIRPGTVVESEAELVALALQNLVGNAVKYGGERAVRIGFDGGEGGGTLWVSDRGPGIAPQMLGQIFEAFKRGEVHGQQGVGLGLAIASQAAKMLRADLAVESVLGEGSTFRLTFAATP
jgi:signal transduction histidine kinase